MAKAAGVGSRPWQGAEGQPATHLVLLSVLQKGFAPRWPNLKASGIAQEARR